MANRLNHILNHVVQKSHVKPSREYYKHFCTLPTRWHDNDIYGHINNVVSSAFFDTVINSYLIIHGGLDIQKSPVIGVCVSSACEYKKSLSFPDELEGGLRVSKIGHSSVKYEVGIFKKGDTVISAYGHFVHVFVDRETQTPVPIPALIKSALQDLYQTEM